jgi:glycosyltransferase involved in cell wall biosynthesis
MKLSIACKLDPYGAFGFIKPISDVHGVTQVDVFRDEPALAYEKVKYHYPSKGQGNIISHIKKFFNMMRILDKHYTLSIGIYEIPHGLLAYMSGRFKKVPCVISIIGNPGYRQLRKGIRQAISKYMYKRCHAVTVTGSKSKKILIEQGIKEDKIFILPNSIDIEKFKPVSTDKKYDIVSLGRLSEEKELGNFIKIIKELKKDIPNIKAAIAGKGPEENKLKQMIKDLDLSDNIDMPGYVEDITKFYNSSRLFLLTSHTEGLPRTILEAMACEIPCIASNVGDMSDIIDHGENGILINDSNNIPEFLKQIKSIFNDKKLYDMISKNARLKIINKYSYDSATKLWKNIIEKLEKA